MSADGNLDARTPLTSDIPSIGLLLAAVPAMKSLRTDERAAGGAASLGVSPVTTE